MKKDIKFFTFIVTPVLACVFLLTCSPKDPVYHIGILQWTENIDAFRQTHLGVIDGLINKGYKDGINLKIEYRNAEQDKDIALKITREFVNKGVHLIVSLGTGSSLAALKGTEESRIPIVYTIVDGPKATGIIEDYNDSGKNITGISMKVPVKDQFDILKEIMPRLKGLGILYCTEMPQSVASGKEAAYVARDFGWEALTVAVTKEQLPRLEERVKSLAENMGAIYIPSDPFIYLSENMEKIIRVSDSANIPVFPVTKKFVEFGGLMALHCDFYELGRQAADPIKQVLDGADVRTIPSQQPLIKRLSLNLKKAKQLKIEIKRNLILKADNILS